MIEAPQDLFWITSTEVGTTLLCGGQKRKGGASWGFFPLLPRAKGEEAESGDINTRCQPVRRGSPKSFAVLSVFRARGSLTRVRYSLLAIACREKRGKLSSKEAISSKGVVRR